MERQPHLILVIDDEIGMPDSPERTKLYQEMHAIDHEEAPSFKIAHSVVYEVMRAGVSGYKQSPFGAHQFNGVDLR